MSNKIKAMDIILALLYLPGKENRINEPIIGNTRFTKMIFLFEKEIKPVLGKKIDEGSMPEFIAFNYGPYSRDLMDQLEYLINLGLVEKCRIESTSIDANYENRLNELDNIVDDLFYDTEQMDIDSSYFNSSLDVSIASDVDEDEDDPYGTYNITPDNDIEDNKESEYRLTDKGIQVFEEKVKSKFEGSNLDFLEKFKNRITTLSLPAILSYVYNKYPDYAENSLIKEKYLKK
ncbi:hypothetical protein [Clostridium sp. UBA1652]|uniref:hypothetical protein n=1 Tax=Clostridium sp. UBA1652 TaxID=1946348 RepID=UPI00257D780C|nr:hypothetical protein [Clostridium sp. UBA1652]